MSARVEGVPLSLAAYDVAFIGECSLIVDLMLIFSSILPSVTQLL